MTFAGAGAHNVLTMKNAYRVIKETAEDCQSVTFTGRAAAIRDAKQSAANWPVVYILKQGAFDAWNTGEEIFRAVSA